MKFEADVSWDNGMTISRKVKEFSAPNRAAALEEARKLARRHAIHSLKRVIDIPISTF